MAFSICTARTGQLEAESAFWGLKVDYCNGGEHRLPMKRAPSCLEAGGLGPLGMLFGARSSHLSFLLQIRAPNFKFFLSQSADPRTLLGLGHDPADLVSVGNWPPPRGLCCRQPRLRCGFELTLDYGQVGNTVSSAPVDHN